MRNSKVRFISQGALIAALYVVLTYVSSLLGLSSGAVQIRFSEALTILPFFTAAAVPGLFIGCLLANLLIGAVILDIVLGSLATLVAALIAYLLRRQTKWIAPLPNVVVNTITVPFIIAYGYSSTDSIPYMIFTVGLGEIISCYILGMALLLWINKNRKALPL